LVQLIQAIQPIAASPQQGKARTGESVEGELASWAGDRVPDSAFMDEQEPEPWIDEDGKNEDLETPEPVEPALPHLEDDLHPAKPEASPWQPGGASALTFSDEWVTEAEAAPGMGSSFQWVG
jgi:hypothetical protein